MDNGGAGMSTLQLMLLQCDGKSIQILPAWPDDWTADFKLHMPYQTTVEGHVEHGKKVKTAIESHSQNPGQRRSLSSNPRPEFIHQAIQPFVTYNPTTNTALVWV